MSQCVRNRSVTRHGRGRRTRTGRRALWVVVGALALLLFSACRQDLPLNTFAPEGPQARKLDSLFFLVFWLAVGVFVLVEGLIVFAVIRYRRRPGREHPVQVHGNTKLEIMWTVIPAAILVVIAVPTIQGIFDLARRPTGDVVEVRVIAHQWWWEFEYPDLGVVTANELHIPVQKPVYIALESREPAESGTDRKAIPVIHSFWVPRLGGKQDVIPGRTNYMTLEADRPGTFAGQCAEYCGISHANMRLRVIAETQEDFDAWTERMHAPAGAPPADSPEAEGAELFQAFPGGSCLACHGVEPGSGGAVGPSLQNFGSRTTFGAGLFENTPENLARWLDNPRAMKPGAIMPDYGLSSDQIDALVAYLRSLK
jgi:cytochrome c oxidase subunit II